DSSLCGTTWGIATLPYVEQTAQYQLYDQNLANFSGTNANYCQAQVPVHKCPTDPLAGKIDLTRGWAINCRISSYKAVGGVSRIPAEGASFWTWANCEINTATPTSARRQDAGVLPCVVPGGPTIARIAS